jgi:hypothetical protein
VIRRTRGGRHRDIALTTLIDLLVQIVFVFTLLLIAADAMETETPAEQGWVTPEAWKTLISIFDVDPRQVRAPAAQISEIRGKYERMKDDLHACDSKLGACDRQAGRGPGNATCRNPAGAEMVVMQARIDDKGRITVARGRHSGELEKVQALRAGTLGVPLSVEDFGSAFRTWREHGLAQHPPCAFKAEVAYDPGAPAGRYEPARRAIAGYFTLSAPPRRF